MEGNNTVAMLIWTEPSGVFDKVTITWGVSQSKEFVAQETTSTTDRLTPGESYTFTAQVFSNGVESQTNTSSDSITLGMVYSGQFIWNCYKLV